METISFFADENIRESLIDWLRQKEFDISGIRTENLFALDDEIIIEKAFKEKRIILTHDNDFGKIIYTQKVRFYSIIYLRPGHHEAAYHIATLEKILNYSNKIKEGSIIVGSRNRDKIK